MVSDKAQRTRKRALSWARYRQRDTVVLFRTAASAGESPLPRFSASETCHSVMGFWVISMHWRCDWVIRTTRRYMAVLLHPVPNRTPPRSNPVCGEYKGTSSKMHMLLLSGMQEL